MTALEMHERTHEDARVTDPACSPYNTLGCSTVHRQVQGCRRHRYALLPADDGPHRRTVVTGAHEREARRLDQLLL